MAVAYTEKIWIICSLVTKSPNKTVNPDKPNLVKPKILTNDPKFRGGRGISTTTNPGSLEDEGGEEHAG